MKTEFSTEKEFIEAVAPAAQKACKRYGYLPSVLIAQSCLENGYGIPDYWDNKEIKYLLQYNNMVGQKAELLNSSWSDKTVWPGKSFNKKTPEVYSNKQVIIEDSFRIFDNPEQSFCDFILFLLYASTKGKNGTPKYGRAVVDIKDPTTLIKKVNTLGYATDPSYYSQVMKIVNKHNLTKYDNLAAVTASNYIPASLKSTYAATGSTTPTTASTKINIPNKTIHDITRDNLSQVPASRGNNKIEWIVIHYLGVANADNPYLYGGGYGGHYNIKRNGEIYYAANPKTAVVWHCGGGLQGDGGHKYHKICTNWNSIGIENGVGYENGKWYFTEQTQKSLVFLVSKLMDDYNIDIDHVIRHYDVTGKICPAPYVNNDKFKTSWTWDEFKSILKQYHDQKHGKTTTSTAPTNTTPAKPKVMVLELHSTGDEVKKMQTMLIKLGYYCGTAGVDGHFGGDTLKAVKKFQADYDLEVDGYYGPASQAMLNKLYEKYKNIASAKTYNSNIERDFTTTSRLNMRTGPGMGYRSQLVLPRGAEVTCRGFHTDNWYQIFYKDYMGFCSKTWLR